MNLPKNFMPVVVSTFFRHEAASRKLGWSQKQFDDEWDLSLVLNQAWKVPLAIEVRRYVAQYN